MYAVDARNKDDDGEVTKKKPRPRWGRRKIPLGLRRKHSQEK